MAIEYGPYALLAVAAGLNFASSLYNRHVARNARKADEALANEKRKQDEWKDQVDRRLDRHQRKFDILWWPVKDRLGVDIRLKE